MDASKTRASHLSPVEMFRLDLACKPLAEAFDFPYLVGSVMERRDFRDVDVRLILSDERYDGLFGNLGGEKARAVLGMAVSAYLRDATGLPVDFQFQRMTEANARHGGKPRNPLGTRDLTSFVGDAKVERCPCCGGTEHVDPLPGTVGRRCVKCCNVG